MEHSIGFFIKKTPDFQLCVSNPVVRVRHSVPVIDEKIGCLLFGLRSHQHVFFKISVTHRRSTHCTALIMKSSWIWRRIIVGAIIYFLIFGDFKKNRTMCQEVNATKGKGSYGPAVRASIFRKRCFVFGKIWWIVAKNDKHPMNLLLYFSQVILSG